VKSFSDISGDKNKIHLDEVYAAKTFFKKPIVHGAFLISVLSSLIAENYSNVILLSMDFKFTKALYVGEVGIYTIKSSDTGEDKISSFTIFNENREACVIGSFKTREKINKDKGE
jgi:3-hydroxybutyryl-CoA dehydratase